MVPAQEKRRRLDEATCRRLAVLCDCDPRSIQKTLRGAYVRGLAGQRIRAQLAAAGVDVPPEAQERQG